MRSLQEDMGGHVNFKFYTTEFSILATILSSEFSTLTPYTKPNFGTLRFVDQEIRSMPCSADEGLSWNISITRLIVYYFPIV